MFRLMHKIVATVFFIFGLSVLGFSQENITITTYYPSPFGSYLELRAQQMAIGATYFNRTSVCWGGAAAGCPVGSVNPTAVTDLVVEGRVGIGTAVPGYSLDVNGQIRTTNDNPLKFSAGQWGGYSDKRLKKDIEPLRGALEKISQLQGSIFKWINPQLHVAGERAGVIGQDLQKVFPEWVSHVKPEGEDKDLIPAGEDALVVAFPGDFNAYLIEALKELKSENDVVKARITALEAKLNVRQ